MNGDPSGPSRVSRRRFVSGSLGVAAVLALGQSAHGQTPVTDLTVLGEEELLIQLTGPAQSITAREDVLIEIFARSGIAVFDDAVTAPLKPPFAPVSPLSFQRWQLTAMANEIFAGNIQPASVFDEIFPTTTQDGAAAPTVGELLAGYSGIGTTSGSRITQIFFDAGIEENFHIGASDLPAPTFILALFSGELLGQMQQALGYAHARSVSISGLSVASHSVLSYRQNGTTLPGLPDIPPVIDTATAPLPPIQGETICGMAQSFISIVLDRVYSVLKAADSLRDIPIIGAIIGVLTDGVRLGLNLIANAFNALVAPVVNIIKTIGAGLAVASMVIGTLSPWSLAIVPNPSRTRFGIDAEIIQGEFDISAGGWDQIAWPPIISECAALIGLELPKPTSAGAPVTVSVRQSLPLILLDPPNLSLDDEGTTVATYTTQNETSEQAKGPEVTGIAWTTAVVEREDLKKLRDDLFKLLFSQLPDIIAQVVQPMVGPVMNDFSNKLINLLKASGTTPLFVTYHELPEPTPAPTSEPATGGGNCLVGQWQWVDPMFVQRMYFVDFPIDVVGGCYWEFAEDGGFRLWYDSMVVTITIGEGFAYVFTFTGDQLGNYVVDGDVLTITISQNNALMEGDFQDIVGPFILGVPMSGSYRCGNPMVWTPDYPGVGVTLFEFTPVG